MRVWHSVDIQFTNRYMAARWPNQPVPWIRHGSHVITTVKEQPHRNGRYPSDFRMVRNTFGSHEGVYKMCDRWSKLALKMKETPM